MQTDELLSTGLKEVLKLERCQSLPDIATCFLIKKTQKTFKFFTGRGRKSSDPRKKSTYVV